MSSRRGGSSPLTRTNFERFIMDHYYVYYKTKDTNEKEFWVYERTTSTKESAKSRVEELKKKYIDALYKLNELLECAFY